MNNTVQLSDAQAIVVLLAIKQEWKSVHFEDKNDIAAVHNHIRIQCTKERSASHCTAGHVMRPRQFAEHVEITIDHAGKVSITVDGKLIVRIDQTETIIIDHKATVPAFPRRSVIFKGKAFGSLIE